VRPLLDFTGLSRDFYAVINRRIRRIDSSINSIHISRVPQPVLICSTILIITLILVVSNHLASRVVLIGLAWTIISSFACASILFGLSVLVWLWRRGNWKLFLILFVAAISLVAYFAVAASVVLLDRYIDERLKDSLPNRNQFVITMDGSEGHDLQLADQSERIVTEDELVNSRLFPALIAVEDRRACQRPGPFDPRSLMRASYKTFVLGNREGGSGLQLQTAKILSGKLRSEFVDKPFQFLVAIRIDQRFPSCEEIATLYGNLVPIAGRRGFASAALLYFNRSDLRQLTLTESAVLAGIVRAPTKYDPIVHPENARARRNLVLYLMKNQGLISSEEYAVAQRSPLGLMRPTKHVQMIVCYAARCLRATTSD